MDFNKEQLSEAFVKPLDSEKEFVGFDGTDD